AVAAARRGVEEATHPGAFRQLRQAHRGEMVDLVGDLRIQVAERVVRQGCEVNDRGESLEMPALDVAQIQSNLWNLSDSFTKRAGAKKVTIEPDDVVPSVEEHRDQNGSNVPFVTRDEYPHAAERLSHPR